MMLLRVRRAAMTLAVGAAAAMAAASIGFPLPWLLGSMIGVLALMATGRAVELPDGINHAAVVLLGLQVGSELSRSAVERMAALWPNVFALVLYIALGFVTTAAVLRRTAGFDRLSAYFAAAPGGLSVMTVASQDAGAHPAVPVSHAVRSALTVVVLSLVARALSAAPAAVSYAAAPLPLSGALALAACALVSWHLPRFFPFAGARVVWPMIAAASVTALSLAQMHPPRALMMAAQVAFGAAVALRFRGSPRQALRKAITSGFWAWLCLGLLGLLCAVVLYPVVGAQVDFLTLLVAFSPGGIYEMCFLAAAVGASPILVAAHHLLRLGLLTTVAPWLPRLVGRAREGVGVSCVLNKESVASSCAGAPARGSSFPMTTFR